MPTSEAVIPPEYLKIFGERNTSTRALATLLLNNCSSKIPSPGLPPPGDPPFKPKFKLTRKIELRSKELRNDYRDLKRAPPFTWKHRATNFDDVEAFNDYFLIFTVRNPYSWIQSFHKRPYHIRGRRKRELADFAVQKWHPLYRDRMPVRITTPIDLYNFKMASYLNFQTKLRDASIPFKTVEFENFAQDQLSVFRSLSPWLVSPAEDPELITRSTKKTSLMKDDYKQRYGMEMWKSDFSEDARKLITERIDWDIVSAFGYRPW